MGRALLALCLFTAAPAAGQVLDREPATPLEPGNLPFFYNLYTFRGGAGSTLVVGSFAVPAGQLEGRRRDGEVRYRFDVSLVLADTAAGSIHRSDDSVFVASPRPVGGDHLLFTYVEAEAPPSRTVIQRAVMTDANAPGMGQLYQSSLWIPDYSGSRLMLSDIALGQPGGTGGWRRGDIGLALFPTSRFPASAFAVYYEIYNLAHENRYTTELRVDPVDETGELTGDDDEALVLRFAGDADTGPDGVVQELRDVTGSLGTGLYRLTVLVTDEETGETASRSRTFHVRGWDPGATLVTALPRSAAPSR